MSAFRKAKQPTQAVQSSHLTLLDDDNALRNSIRRHPASKPTRWVLVGGKAFCVTPSVYYRGILSDGTDYYPYYDFSLTTIDPDNLDNYELGDNYNNPPGGDTI